MIDDEDTHVVHSILKSLHMAWDTLIFDIQRDPCISGFAIPLFHLYRKAGLHLNLLKGIDRHLFEFLGHRHGWNNLVLRYANLCAESRQPETVRFESHPHFCGSVRVLMHTRGKCCLFQQTPGMEYMGLHSCSAYKEFIVPLIVVNLRPE